MESKSPMARLMQVEKRQGRVSRPHYRALKKAARQEVTEFALSRFFDEFRSMARKRHLIPSQ